MRRPGRGRRGHPAHDLDPAAAWQVHVEQDDVGVELGDERHRLRHGPRLPDHLDGRYLRIGPNPIHEQGEHFHWFLGEGMVHGVHLRDGRARWYRNRWVRSADVATTLGEPVRGTPGATDFAANTNVLEHAGRWLHVQHDVGEGWLHDSLVWGFP